MRTALARFHRDESGHAVTLLPHLVAAVGAILLAVGASDADDTLTIGGGVVLAVGLLGSNVARHLQIDYANWRRMDDLEARLKK